VLASQKNSSKFKSYNYISFRIDRGENLYSFIHIHSWEEVFEGDFADTCCTINFSLVSKGLQVIVSKVPRHGGCGPPLA
jgi:hypothetical protein